MKCVLLLVIVGVVAAEELSLQALEVKYQPKYDNFEKGSVKGTITMYAKTENYNKAPVNMGELEKRDAEAGFRAARAEAKAAPEHGTLFQDNPLLEQGFDQVAAGKDGFRFKQSKGSHEVFCKETRRPEGLRTADNHAIEFKFSCDKTSNAQALRFKKKYGTYGAYYAGAGYPYHYNGGGYYGNGYGHAWFGAGAGGWGYGWNQGIAAAVAPVVGVGVGVGNGYWGNGYWGSYYGHGVVGY